MFGKVRLLTPGSIAVLLALEGCVSAPPEVDLAPARKAVEGARAWAASAEAKECLARAEQDLSGAEKLASASGAEERSRAAVLASAAVTGAACVDRLEVQARRLADPPAAAATGGSGEPEKLRARQLQRGGLLRPPGPGSSREGESARGRRRLCTPEC